MAVGILYIKANSTIHDLLSDVITYSESRVEYVGGFVEGFNQEEVGVIITKDIRSIEAIIDKEVEDRLPDGSITKIIKPTKVITFLDRENNEINIGDTLPTGLEDISKQFSKKTFDDLVAENETLKQELANTNAMMLEFMETILN